MKKIFDNLSGFWEQNLFARALAYLLIQAEAEMKKDHPGYELGRVFKAKVGDEDLIFSSWSNTR